MSKRTRGTARTAARRPGTRPRTTRPAGARSASPATRPATREESELALAADIADEIADDPAAAQALSRTTRVAQHRPRVKPGSLLAARAATEYVYVAQDMKRIVVVSAVLFGIMLVLYVLLVVARVVPLPFY